MLRTIEGSLYDYPRYYDLVYGSDWSAECRFLISCFQQHARGDVRRVFEPACGTGRLMYRLRQAGYTVLGLDLNRRSVNYCNARLTRHGFQPSAVVGDMTDFRLPRKVDAAFNTVSSFRHLAGERQARSHLQCVADSLRRGGLYVLGIHLFPTRGRASNTESWSARRGHLVVNTRMWLRERNLRRRLERFGLTCDVYTPTQQFRLADELVLRTYTAKQFRRLLSKVASFEVAETYDFTYNIKKPVTVGEATEDVVYVLRKR